MAYRVLVVEDSRTQAEHLRLVLEGAGYTVDVAGAGHEALALALDTPPHLILSDIVMPGMDGYGFCSAVKAHPTLRHVPVLLCTERGEVRDIIAGTTHGADGFVTKPIDAEELLDRISAMLERRLGMPAGPCAGSAASPATVLVVDDERDMREVLAEYLATAGHRVVTAAGGAEALRLATVEPPDVVLTDVTMPGMNGIELCARIKNDPRLQAIPVVILTAVGDRESRILGLSAGADDFFSKPVDFAELGVRVASLLRVKRLQDELAAKTKLLGTLFGQYVSEGVVRQILSDPVRHSRLSSEKREVTILFGDLRGFTAMADALDADDVVAILNRYLTEAVDVVFRFNGTLDKFRGDGIMVVFGAPVALPDHAMRAVRCALELQSLVQRLDFPQFPDLRLHLGVGINSGSVVVGSIGSPRRMDYTAIGSEVNLAQRFEAQAGPGQVLITQSTYTYVKEAVTVRDLGLLRVSGAKRPVAAFDVLGLIPDGTPPPQTS